MLEITFGNIFAHFVAQNTKIPRGKDRKGFIYFFKLLFLAMYETIGL